jgi:hypothetical protein
LLTLEQGFALEDWNAFQKVDLIVKLRVSPGLGLLFLALLEMQRGLFEGAIFISLREQNFMMPIWDELNLLIPDVCKSSLLWLLLRSIKVHGNETSSLADVPTGGHSLALFVVPRRFFEKRRRTGK